GAFLMENQELLKKQLEKLRAEHATLESRLKELTASPVVDQLCVQRLKRKKLHLKDEITKIAEDSYRITMAVAGFRREDLNVTLQDNVLIISGKADLKDDSVEYLHRGIAGRAFERHFQLADFIKVIGAAMEHGLLKVNLQREVPEAMKPRTINIEDEENKSKLIEQ
ncbi:uncharacterized protein LOC111320507, partial [Stylophora pistillata]|uniref:uncharacterized protein LOC111320507 n=1 Tax=Stylophora pistillata TaxID=50429 RepID=UPI000C03B90A